MSSDDHVKDAINTDNGEIRRVKLLEHNDYIVNTFRKACEENFLTFARGIRIAAFSGSKRFDDVKTPFQMNLFTELAPNLQQLRDGEKPKLRRFWIERTKKASKDADLAVIIAWIIGFAKRPFYAQVGAADREQASIVKDRLSHLLYWNPWLNDYIEIIRNQVKSKSKMNSGQPLATLDIMSADVAGAHGGTPDLLIVNELSHITKWEFVQNLMDNADGVPRGMVIIATNAGFKGTPAEVWRNDALSSHHWGVNILDRPAPWHSKETIEIAKRRNTKSRFNRLWKGRWVSGKGDTLSEEVIDQMFVLAGMSDKEDGWFYVGGLDLGITHDHSAACVLGVNRDERMIKTVYLESWAPNKKSGQVDLIMVEDRVRWLAQKYGCSFWYDPTEARLMAQRLSRTVQMREMKFSVPKNLNLMAESLIQCAENRTLKCFDVGGALRRDFGKFDIVEKPYGYKLEAVSDEYGHADLGTALVIALPGAVSILDDNLTDDPDRVIYDDGDHEDLEESEVDEMPDELRAIYDL